jgi:endonuclease YncB( thermonuclease family)
VCQVWTGKVIRVNDGDTLSVDLAGDGTSAPRSIRIINAQAMEQTVYSSIVRRRKGECHSLAATARLEQLVKAGGGVVRLTAQHASSSSRNRPLRSVAVKINGVWRDVCLDLLRRGHALWQPFADGSDEKNLNGEWVRVENRSDVALPLAGWWVRDSALRRYTFPAGTVVPARDAVYVHVGSGTPTASHKYWGLTAPAFDNPTVDDEARGDGAYLFDPQGDLRAWMQYPCVLSCPVTPARA